MRTYDDGQNLNLELLTISEVAKLFRVSVPTIRRLQGQRQIPFIKIGGKVRFAKADLVFYLQKHRIEAIDHRF